MAQHLTALGVLYLVFSGLNVIAAIILFAVLTGGGLVSGEPKAFFVTATVGTVIGSVLVLLALPGIIGGIGILQRKSWARILLLVLAVLNLFHFPVGTIIAVYTFWVLTRPETMALLEGAPGARI